MSTLTRAAWHDRILTSLDALSDASSAFLLAVTRDPDFASTLVYMDDLALLFSPEMVKAITDDQTPAYALLALGCPADVTSRDGSAKPAALVLFVACLDDDDTVTAVHDGEWRVIDSEDMGDGASQIRTRLWELMLESAIAHKE